MRLSLFSYVCCFFMVSSSLPKRSILSFTLLNIVRKVTLNFVSLIYRVACDSFLFFQSCLSECLIIFLSSARKMKKIKKIWVLGWRSLLPEWVCFCQAPGSCSDLGSSQSNFKNWGDSELGCRAYEDLGISGSSLFLGDIPSESQPKWRRIHQAPWLGWASDSDFCPLIPGWSGCSAILSRIRGHPSGQVAPCACLTFWDLYSPRIWLDRVLLSCWFLMPSRKYLLDFSSDVQNY